MTAPDSNQQGSTPATEGTLRRLPWWTPWVAAAAVAVVVIGLGSWIVAAQDDAEPMRGDGMSGATAGVPPLVTGYYDDEQIQFQHTEVSDAEVAGLLTDMMDGSPVIHTPTLAKASGDMVAPVYVFTNGVQPDGPRGPFGFQPDIFDAVPGDAGYSPLRAVHLVEWSEDADPTVLTSTADIDNAERDGEISITTPGIVVNMPVISWPGGSR